MRSQKNKKPIFYVIGTLAFCGLIAAAAYFWTERKNETKNAAEQPKIENPQQQNTDEEINISSGSSADQNVSLESVPVKNLDEIAPIPEGQVAATLNIQDLHFYLNARVSSEQVAATTQTIVNEVFGSEKFATVNIEVDLSLPAEPWEENLESVVGDYGLTVVDGQLEISGNQTLLTANAIDDLFLEYLRNLLVEENGFTPLTEDITFLDKQPPTIHTAINTQKVVLEGTVETEFLKELIISEMTTLHPEKEIVENIEVSDQVFTRISLLRIGAFTSLFKPFDESSAGLANDQLYVVLPQGVNFQSNSTNLTEEEKRMVSDLYLFLTPANATKITGHTDNTGSEESNLELSEQRAEVVAGIIQEQLPSDYVFIVEGKGEAEPIATNDTEEGKAQNRRVQIKHFPIGQESEITPITID